jgi:hypothetical protein
MSNPACYIRMSPTITSLILNVSTSLYRVPVPSTTLFWFLLGLTCTELPLDTHLPQWCGRNTPTYRIWYLSVLTLITIFQCKSTIVIVPLKRIVLILPALLVLYWNQIPWTLSKVSNPCWLQPSRKNLWRPIFGINQMFPPPGISTGQTKPGQAAGYILMIRCLHSSGQNSRDCTFARLLSLTLRKYLIANDITV